MAQIDTLLFWLITLGIVVGSLVGFAIHFKLSRESYRHLKHSGSMAEGEVVEIGQHGEEGWFVVYRFSTKQGQQVEQSELVCFDSLAKYRVGARVDVYFDPLAPKTSRLA